MLALGLVVFLGGLVLVYAKWWAWYGGVAWGPRFFAFAAVPASLFLAVRLHRPQGSIAGDGLTLVVLVLSGWVGVIGAIGGFAAVSVCFENSFALESFCWYVPEYSSLWRPFLGFPELTASTWIVAAFCAVVFVYLALPVAVAMGRAVRLAMPRARVLDGWRF